MDDAFFHQFDGAFWDGNDALGTYQVLTPILAALPAPSAPLCRRRADDDVRDHHAVAKSALAQRRLQIGHALVALSG